MGLHTHALQLLEVNTGCYLYTQRILNASTSIQVDIAEARTKLAQKLKELKLVRVARMTILCPRCVYLIRSYSPHGVALLALLIRVSQ